MWLYVIGPVLGRENLNREAFVKARNELWDAGYHVLIPHDVVSPEASNEQTMQNRIMAMLRCDGIALLNGWEESEEAKFECDVAIFCGLNVQHYQEWLNRATSWLCGSSQLLSITSAFKEIYSHPYPIREWFKKEEDDNN